MRVYKRGNTYWLDWYEGKRRRRMPAFPNRRASEHLARRLEQLVDIRDTGIDTAGPELMRWIEQIPDRLRDRLVKLGLLTARRASGSRPLREHLADFGAALEGRDRSAKHVRQTHDRALAIVDGCGFRFWSEITGHRVGAYLKARRDGAMGAATSNHYLRAVKAFCKWMVQEGRASEHPLQHVRYLNVDVDRRRERRALTLGEMRDFLQATAAGPKRHRLTGPERQLIYRFALETGLRASEIRSLTRTSFDLRSDPPTVTVAAGYSKRKHEDTVILRPALAAELKLHLFKKRAGDRIFALPERAAEMLRKDLEAAEIDYKTEAGVLDFHALRHCFASNLADAGVHPKIAQSLLRHSAIGLTMDIYSHLGREREVEALEGLPDLSAPEPDEKDGEQVG